MYVYAHWHSIKNPTISPSISNWVCSVTYPVALALLLINAIQQLSAQAEVKRTQAAWNDVTGDMIHSNWSNFVHVVSGKNLENYKLKTSMTSVKEKECKNCMADDILLPDQTPSGGAVNFGSFARLHQHFVGTNPKGSRIMGMYVYMNIIYKYYSIYIYILIVYIHYVYIYSYYYCTI